MMPSGLLMTSLPAVVLKALARRSLPVQVHPAYRFNDHIECFSTSQSKVETRGSLLVVHPKHRPSADLQETLRLAETFTGDLKAGNAVLILL